jgi:hypothetical protein
MERPQHKLFDDHLAAAQSATSGSDLGQNAVPFRLENFAGSATFPDKPIFNPFLWVEQAWRIGNGGAINGSGEQISIAATAACCD